MTPPDAPCPHCGLRSCLVEALSSRHDRTGAKLAPAERKKLETEIVKAKETCSMFHAARVRPS